MDLVQGIPGVSLTQEVEEEEFPRVPTDLLEALEAQFPDRCPALNISQVDYGVVQGRLDVVRFLRQVHDRPSVMTKEQP